MNIYLAFALFSLMILLYWVISELFTILFRFTGLPDEKARFQVISLLTGCGFTTRESEMIISTRPRRRLARITMLFGYVFNITIVSAFINVFLSLKIGQMGDYMLGILIPLAVLAVILIFIRVPAVRAWGEQRLQRLAGRIVRGEEGNEVLLLDYIGKDSIAQVTLRYIPEEHQGVPLAKTGLKADTGILVMLVESPGEKARPAGADTVFRLGDKLTVFGDYATIRRTFHAHERFTED
ncbi:MAG: hypothetical protein IK095_00455 [Oscillospiraceae bacterium]|nr:hypothetical protein [Oscillospiraceae bacterium]